MYNLNFYYSYGELKAVSKLYKNKKLVKKLELSNEQIIDFISSLEEDKHDIKRICFDGRDLTFYNNTIKVRLVNKKIFKMDNKFDFVFDVINSKKYKLNKSYNKRSIAFLLAVGITVSPVIYKNIYDKIQNHETIPYSSMDKDYKKDDILYTDDTINELDNIKTTSVNSNEKIVNSADEDVINDNKSVINDEKIDVGLLNDSEKYLKTRELYGETIEKYSEIYGVDSDVICAIATQERGVHSSSVDSGGAIGLMQIQVGVWNGESLTAYNNKIGSVEKIKVTLNKLKDIDFNLNVGCAIFQNCLKKMNGNIYAAIQCYNMGEGSMNKILRSYSYKIGKSVDDILNDNDLGWMNYRKGYSGDSKYLENVLRYYENTKEKTNKVIS